MYINCLCGGYKYRVYNFKRDGVDFEVIECSRCGLGRTWPIPLLKEDKQVFYNEQDDFNERLEQAALWRKFLNRALKIIKKYKKEGDLLEVGCNVGLFIDLANRNGYNAYGIDLSKRATDFGKERFNLNGRLSQGSLIDRKGDSKRYDVIAYIHVMEHIERIEDEFNLIKSALAPDGILYIETPNFNSCWRKALKSSWYGFSPKQHIWQFSRKPLEDILKKNGFKIIFSATRHSMHHEISFSFKGFIKAVLHLASFIFNCGDNLTVVAKKAN